MRVKACVPVFLLKISYLRKRVLVRGEEYELQLEAYLGLNPMVTLKYCLVIHVLKLGPVELPFFT